MTSQLTSECPKCEKPIELCVCEAVTPMDTNLHVLILQHPQEPDKLLGTARLAHLALKNSTLKIGLSWPNLTKALGRPAVNANWGVLYLGGKQNDRKLHEPQSALAITAKGGKTFSIEEANLEGIVVLDGTWSQAKALWWRNPWLLKLKRLILNPKQKSLYGKLRREPRRECLSTIESIGETLDALGENPEVNQQLRQYFSQLLEKAAKSTMSHPQTREPGP